MRNRALARWTLIAATLLCLGACAWLGRNADVSRKPGALRAVAHVDLSRYMGDWFVVANIPYFAENDCVDSLESYALRADGRIDNRFSCREKSFDAPMKRKLATIATVHDKSSNAEWRVPFFEIVRVRYVVIDLDPDYQWAVIGHPSRRYGWVLSRTRALPDATYKGILDRLRAQGYDTSKFARVPQREPASASTSQSLPFAFQSFQSFPFTQEGSTRELRCAYLFTQLGASIDPCQIG
jgi:apolipoprotein D and lipocalin family protein